MADPSLSTLQTGCSPWPALRDCGTERLMLVCAYVLALACTPDTVNGLCLPVRLGMRLRAK